MFEVAPFCSLLILSSVMVCSASVNDDFKIWGPGLKPHILIMPARYFFINHNGNISCDDIKLDISVGGTAKAKHSCRIWTNVLRTPDCWHIVRYKLYETCENIEISVKYKGDHVSDSPYIFSESIREETCYCPKKAVNSWLNEWECGDVPQRIKKDLGNFNSIDFNKLRPKIIAKYDNPGAVSLCHYVVKNNQIYRKCYGKYVGFKMFMDSILSSVSRKVEMPDLEFFVNLGDWPLVKELTDKFPIFSWCSSTDSYDIVMPTYDITESTLESMGRVMLDMLSVQGNVKNTWSERIPKVFWRGRDSSRERLNLIDISRRHPDLFNASLTNFFFFRDEEEKYGPKSEYVSFFKFFDYKYQLSLDGTVAAYRLPYLLGGGSLLFKQESKYYEHFYNQLIANVHYIPIKRDLSDLVEKINWAIDNEEQARLIAESGQAFAREHLLPKNIFCYHMHLFTEYSKKIVSEIEVLDDMELVENSKDSTCVCNENYKDEL